ncbi:hypothetical protein E2C01_031844 [Portunus trituberculatus]|uniref:Uncharacterized protein n=1 Tax=Portunus trituberculatus TaxID=210409 RepID=A0A5B7EZ97_PORTR|nr:hypothetical protein [Portunus trituberculatus]
MDNGKNTNKSHLPSSQTWAAELTVNNTLLYSKSVYLARGPHWTNLVLPAVLHRHLTLLSHPTTALLSMVGTPTTTVQQTVTAPR